MDGEAKFRHPGWPSGKGPSSGMAGASRIVRKNLAIRDGHPDGEAKFRGEIYPNYISPWPSADRMML